MKANKEQIIASNEELIEQLMKDFKSILYTQRPLKVKLKMFYAAKYSAEYFFRINHEILRRLSE